jgi:hypothetical protein
MVDQPQQTDLLARYLLGELSETEQERLEEQYFSDDALLIEMLAVEDQLIDDFLRNKLTAEERRRFERGYLSFSCKREKVEFAALARTAGKEWKNDRRAPVEPNKTPWFLSLPAFFKSLQPRVWVPVAAGLALVSSLTFFATRPSRLDSPPILSASTDPASRLPLGPSLISVSLSPVTTTRSSNDEEVKTAQTDAATEAIELKLKVTGEKYPKYQGRLQKLDEGGREVLRDDSLKPAKDGDDRIVLWKVEARQLNIGDYQVELQGVKTTGDLGETSTYGFNLRTR